MTSSPRQNDYSITLADGRQLGYAEYGAANGVPVIFCHGAPGSRLSIFGTMSEVAAERGIRLIAPDRPGFGLSTYCERESLVVWASDLRELLARLDIHHCYVLGFSMGSLVAFAAAYALPEQIDRVAIVGAAAPMEQEGVLDGLSPASQELFALARTDAVAFASVITPMTVDGASVFAAMAATMSAQDQAALAAQAEAFRLDFAAAVATDGRGLINDLVLASNPWGFSPAAIRSRVDLWSGSEDTNTPPAMTRYMAKVLSNHRLFELPGSGHCCLYTHWAQILDRLLDPVHL